MAGVNGIKANLKDLLKPHRWQLDYLYSYGPSGWSTHTLIVILTFLTQDASVSSFVPWLSVMLLLSMLMAAGCWFMSRDHQYSLRTVQIFGWAHTVLTLCVGITWGVGAVMSAQSNADEFLVYTLALGGTALGAVSTQHSVIRSCFASIWSSIPILAFAHASSDKLQGGWMTPLMMLLYGIVLSVMAVRMHRFVHANYVLNEELKLQVRKTQKLNRQYLSERDRADAANTAKSRFLAHASHDLRHPVHSIGLLIEGLRGEQLEERQANIIADMKTSITSLAGLLKSLMDLSALDVGKITSRPEATSAHSILAALEKANWAVAKENGIELRIVDSKRWVETDPNLLINIGQNLISNAIKHSGSDRILVGFRKSGAGLSIVVADRGKGIRSEQQKEVFLEFNRGDTDSPSGSAGLGLGLAIVSELVELLDLSCTMSSIHGQGTYFQVGPLKIVAPSEKRVALRTLNEHPLNGLNVLLLNNDKEGETATEYVLSGWGCQVFPPESYGDRFNKIDFLVASTTQDHNAEVFDKIEFFRKQERNSFPTILITAQPEEEIISISPKGNIHVLQKPAKPAAIRALMTSIAMQQRVTQTDLVSNRSSSSS